MAINSSQSLTATRYLDAFLYANFTRGCRDSLEMSHVGHFVGGRDSLKIGLCQEHRPWHARSAFAEDRATLESDLSAARAGYTVAWTELHVPSKTLSPYRKPFNAVNSALR